jgi:DDE family transposase/transposase-like protein DUF772
MQSTSRECLEQFCHILQSNLFERLEEELGSLGASARLLIAVLSAVGLEKQLGPRRGWRGRPSKDRHGLAASFVAKAIYGIQTTRQLRERLASDAVLRRLCGWRHANQLPHESTFSRAFSEFARRELPQRLHEALIRQTQHDRLIGHIARDATAIEARERFPEPSAVRKQQKKRRPKRARATERGTRLERQRRQPIARQLAELPQACSIGTKKSSKGYQQYWRGYKLHLDVADGQIPISALLTGAHVHDSQAAIPLMTLSTQRVTYLYDLMDSAYDARAIQQQSRALGHRSLVDPKPRFHVVKTKVPLRKNSRFWKWVRERKYYTPELPPAEWDRLAERNMVERVYSRLKDEFGGRTVRVRGAAKVMAHLMFGLLALTVDQLLKLSG